ncbi:MAG: alpha/beta fold hydrolase [Ilumatobacteraceae bacterium]
MADQDVPSRRVRLASGPELRIIERGDGEPRWLLVHGLASNARLWDGVARRLATSGATTVAVDQRGHGLSDRPDDGYDMATVADDLAHLADALGWETAFLAGQSWGGNVVLEALARHPERFLGAVCVDGGFIRLRDRFESWDDCATALAPPPLIGTPVEQMRRWVDNSAADWPEEGRLGTMANFEVRDDGTIAPWLTRERHMAILAGMWDHDPSVTVAGLDRSIHVIAADTGDRYFDKSSAVGQLIDAATDAQVTWFRPAHHDVHAQQPDAVSDVLRGFADRVAP